MNEEKRKAISKNINGLAILYAVVALFKIVVVVTMSDGFNDYVGLFLIVFLDVFMFAGIRGMSALILNILE